jgi:hypothetical protein
MRGGQVVMPRRVAAADAARIVGAKRTLAQAGEVEGDDDVLAVGGDDFDESVVGGDVGGVVD